MCKSSSCGCGASSGAATACAAAAAAGAGVAAAGFVLDHVVLLLAMAVIVAAGTYGAVRLLAQRMVLVPPPSMRQPARRALLQRSNVAPRAIEAPRPPVRVVEGQVVRGRVER